MKKSLKISILLIILFIILTFTFIKLIHYPYSEQEQNDLKLEEIKNSTLKYNDDPIVYESKSEKVKGIIQNIQLNGAVINLTNSYFFSETLGSYKEGNSLDEYNILNLHLAENTHILNYIDSSEIRFEDIDIKVFHSSKITELGNNNNSPEQTYPCRTHPCG